MIPVLAYTPKNPKVEVSELPLVQQNALIGQRVVLTTIEGELWWMAKKYDIDYDRFYNLAWCESTLNQSARGKAGEIGIYQFLPDTFTRYAKLYKKVGFSIYNINHQIELTAQMISEGEENNWVCVY